jgi:hypothetical protein
MPTHTSTEQNIACTFLLVLMQVAETRIQQPEYLWDLNVCDDGILIQLMCFWTLIIALFLFKHVSDIGFCLRLQIEPIQFLRSR